MLDAIPCRVFEEFRNIQKYMFQTHNVSMFLSVDMEGWRLQLVQKRDDHTHFVNHRFTDAELHIVYYLKHSVERMMDEVISATNSDFDSKKGKRGLM